ncbi:PIN domain-containing protein [Bacillus badius]|uniref:DUF4935 domain-containing protein n=1 Tax=Bacillus badius TaxID=1455 RepID=A0ABR5B2J7_BACBA|nr:PIN domain-containing protein [Bacillus badius]KIL80718.1 hypothetical protein SD77_0566 [Bacillus badius]MED4715354.1 PIN domain-containing protein [Bacillus badius]
MEIFLDSNIIYSDPFMESIYAQQLLKLAELDFVDIYMASVVVEEIKNNYRKQINKEYLTLNKNISNLSKHTYQNIEKYIVIKKDENYLIEEFNNFYDDLFKRGVIKVLQYPNDILPELINRSIKRIKPFTERKQEFRDAIIWLTYVNYVKENSLVDCHFINNNINDFLEDGKIHPDLKADNNNFIFYRSFREFFSSNNKDLEYVKSEVLTYFCDEIKYRQSDIFELIYSDHFSTLEIESADYIDNNSDYISTDYSLSGRGYLEPAGLDIVEIKNYYVDVINNDIIINGSLLVNQQFEVHEYNPLYEPGDDEYFYSGSDEIDLLIEFTVRINTDIFKEKFVEFDLDNIEIKIDDFEINKIHAY